MPRSDRFDLPVLFGPGPAAPQPDRRAPRRSEAAAAVTSYCGRRDRHRRCRARVPSGGTITRGLPARPGARRRAPCDTAWRCICKLLLLLHPDFGTLWAFPLPSLWKRCPLISFIGTLHRRHVTCTHATVSLDPLWDPRFACRSPAYAALRSTRPRVRRRGSTSNSSR